MYVCELSSFHFVYREQIGRLNNYLGHMPSMEEHQALEQQVLMIYSVIIIIVYYTYINYHLDKLLYLSKTMSTQWLKALLIGMYKATIYLHMYITHDNSIP